MKCFTFILALLASCSQVQHKASSQIQIGWMNGQCIAFKDSTIKPDSKFLLVSLDSANTKYIGTINKRTLASEACPALLEDRKSANLGSGNYFYSIQLEQEVDFGIAILLNKDFTYLDNKVDLNKDGKDEQFFSCTTFEGIQYSVWDGEFNKSNMLWEGYYYLGYDLEPNCPD